MSTFPEGGRAVIQDLETGSSRFATSDTRNVVVVEVATLPGNGGGDAGPPGEGVPTGGTTGQLLAKASAGAYDTEWSTVFGVPDGGSTGQVLAKASATDGDTEWTTSAGTAADISVTNNTLKLSDPSQIETTIDTIATMYSDAFGITLDPSLLAAVETLVETHITAEPDDVQQALANDSMVDALAFGGVIYGQQLGNAASAAATSAQIDADLAESRAAVLAYGLANPHTGNYLEVCGNTGDDWAFQCDTDLGTPTTSKETRYKVWVPAGITANTYLEVLTQTADSGAGTWDAEEAAIFVDASGNILAFGEWTPNGGLVEATGTWSVPAYAGAPGLSAGVWLEIKDRTVASTGVRTWSAMTDGGWRELATFTADTVPTTFENSGEVWQIGRGGATGEHLRLAYVKHYIDGVLVSHVDPDTAADGDTTVEDTVLELSPGTPASWVATNVSAATVVTPADSDLPAAGTSGNLLTSNGTIWTSAADRLPAHSTSGNLLASNGSAWVSTADRLPAHSTSGNILTSNGSAWTSAAPTKTAGSVFLPYYGASTYTGIGIAAVTNNYWGSSAQNDYVEWTYIWLDAGTYTCAQWGQESTDRGSVIIAIDGGTVATHDWYAGSAAIARRTTASIVVATSGFKTVRATTSSKNASSSGYVTRFIEGVAFIRTA